MSTPIQIKANLGRDVAGALNRLGCPDAEATGRDIWFAEPLSTDSTGATPLLSSRIVIRLRSGAADDLTVELRPCQRSQLVGRWSAPFTDSAVQYRIEDDWCAERRMLSAAVVSRRPPGSLRDAVAGGIDITAALDSTQRQFLVSCTPPGVAIDQLRALGPVASLRWAEIPVGEVRADVERWTVLGLDLLGLSLRVVPADDESSAGLHLRALDTQRGLEDGLRALDLTLATGGSKTEQVITALAAARSGHGE